MPTPSKSPKKKGRFEGLISGMRDKVKAGVEKATGKGYDAVKKLAPKLGQSLSKMDDAKNKTKTRGYARGTTKRMKPNAKRMKV